MANPYESDGYSDPFRERVALPPPSPSETAANGPSDSIHGQRVANRDDAQMDTSSPHKPGFVTGTAPISPASGAEPPAADEAAASPKRTSKFWTLEFYQQFFDVSTQQVLIRMSNTLVLVNPPDFLLGRDWHYNRGSAEEEGVTPAAAAAAEAQQDHFILGDVTLSRKPDLYGPIWICTTLWMLLGIVSNIMSKIAATKAEEAHWQYDFSVASVACIVMYLYCFVFGAAVWALMLWKNLPVSLVDTVSLYGYSMFPFILTALLCMVPVGALQWVFCLVGGLWSTAYLLLNHWHMWKVSLEPNWFIGIAALIGLCQMGLTLSFKLYFLRYTY